MNESLSLIDKVKWHAEQTPDRVFLKQPKGSAWNEMLWGEAFQRASAIAHYLSHLPPRSTIGIYSLNCADWFIVDLAIMMSGHISVPIYPTANQSTIQFIIEHSELSLVFVGKCFDWETFSECFNGVTCVSFFTQKKSITHLDDIVNTYTPIEEFYTFKPNDTLTIIYTSGTTGKPKGVMLSYGAVMNVVYSAEAIFEVSNKDRFFSYLPLAHVAERMAVEMASLYFGATVYFVESLDHFSKNLRAAKPTVFFAVPRIWVKIKQGIERKLGGRWFLSLLLNLPVVGNGLKSLLRKSLGLDEHRIALSGGASLSRDVLQWFDRLGIKILEVYGLSETCGFSHVNTHVHRKLGTVGQSFSGSRCFIADNGEIMLQNSSLMQGYYKEPDLTDAVLQDGWFRTGDLGEIDNEGFLTITGRVKELFKTSKGKYISPVPIESKIQQKLDAEHVCVMGQNLSYPVALINFNRSFNPLEKKQMAKDILNVLETVNRDAEKHERIFQYFLVNGEWSVDNDFLTPTFKLRRHAIEKKYLPLVQSYSDKKESVIWE